VLFIEAANPLLSNRIGWQLYAGWQTRSTSTPGAPEDAPRTAARKKLHAGKHAVLSRGVKACVCAACQSRSLMRSDTWRLSLKKSGRQFMKGATVCGKCP